MAKQSVDDTHEIALIEDQVPEGTDVDHVPLERLKIAP
jgi:hypothetical protein